MATMSIGHLAGQLIKFTCDCESMSLALHDSSKDHNTAHCKPLVMGTAPFQNELKTEVDLVASVVRTPVT